MCIDDLKTIYILHTIVSVNNSQIINNIYVFSNFLMNFYIMFKCSHFFISIDLINLCVNVNV